MRFKIYFSCLSHTGNCRSINQDNFICNGRYMEIQNDGMEFPLTGCVSTKTPSVFGVFDGLGGEERGEMASFIAARNASSISIGKDAVADILKYCTDANEKICKYASDNSVSAMGTTAALLVFTDHEITLCNIGDSKIFRISDGQTEQISVDHLAIAAHGLKPPLSQNLGIPPSEMIIDPYVAKGGYNEGDLYLICSDGLTDMVAIEAVTQILAETEFDAAAGKLLNAALDNGGRDNITIILCKVRREKRSLLSRIFQPKNTEKGEKNHGN